MTAKADTGLKHALYQYAAAHDGWSEQEQLLMLEGRHIEAEGAHQYAVMVLRAWLAEKDDPEVAECPS